MHLTKESKKYIYIMAKNSEDYETDPMSRDIITHLHNLSRKPEKLKIDKKKVPKKLLDSKFIASFIKTYIENNIFEHVTYMNVNIYAENLAIFDLDFLQETIYKIFELFEYIAGKTKPVQIHIVLSDYKKRLPAKNEALLPEHINSGYTDKIDNIIFIWRTEEVIKILIHELIHFYNFDGFLHSMAYSGALSKQASEVFNNYFQKFQIEDRKQLKIYESYTESLASFFNAILAVNTSNANINAQIRIYNKLMGIELEYAKYQTAKILDHFGFNNLEELMEKSGKVFYQKTAVFSYYIVRSVIVNNTNLLDLWKTRDSRQYLQLISNGFDNETFRKQVDKLIQRDKFDKSLRMQCTEIDIRKTV